MAIEARARRGPIHGDGPADAGRPSHRAGDLRFSDVIEELRAISDLVGSNPDADQAVVLACGRAASLLSSLRDQFLRDVVFDRPLPQAAS